MKTQPIRVVEGSAKPYEPFWRIKDAVETGGDPEIDFVGYISEYSWMGDEITPKKFKEDLYAAGKGGPITIRMHSGGGEIFAASMIRAMLIDYPGKKTVKIDGIAASAAVAIALAGDEIKMFDTAYMMVHNPGYGFLMGYLDADTLEKFAGQLNVFRQGLLETYVHKTGLDSKQLSKMLDEETWMTAEKAVELGFADEVITGGSPIRKDVTEAVRNYVNVPPALLNAADETMTTSAAPAVDDRDRNTLEAGQEPDEILFPMMFEARVRLALAEKPPFQGETIMNVRDLLKERETHLARAKELTEAADNESRDFTETERAEFEELLGKDEATGKIGVLDAQIAQIQVEREKLRNAAEKKFAPVTAEKPAPTGKPNTMSKDEFEKLSPAARMAFMKTNGKVEG
jgi:ATP-dependent protease ClpP protease subunit